MGELITSANIDLVIKLVKKFNRIIALHSNKLIVSSDSKRSNFL